MRTLLPLFALFLLSMVPAAWAADFTLASHHLKSGQLLTAKYIFNLQQCGGGENLSPELHWQHPPTGTKSFAITMYDTDARQGKGWWHWILVNLPASQRQLPQGAGTPDGAKLPRGSLQIRNSFGTVAYGGPCPPRGDRPHHYRIRIHALDTSSLAVDSSTPPDAVLKQIRHHQLGMAELVVRYGR